MSHEPTLVEIERYALGDLPPDRAAELEALRAEDPELDRQMRRVARDIEDAMPLPALDLGEEEAPELRPKRWAWAAPLLALAAVALFMFRAPPETRFRGTFDLDVHRVRAGEAVRQDALIEGREDDILQFAVTPSTDAFLTIVDIQDDGELSVWVDAEPVDAMETYDRAFRLDGFEGAERIFVVVADEPMNLTEIEDARDRAWRDPLIEWDTLPGLDADQRSVLVVRPGAMDAP